MNSIQLYHWQVQILEIVKSYIYFGNEARDSPNSSWEQHLKTRSVKSNCSWGNAKLIYRKFIQPFKIYLNRKFWSQSFPTDLWLIHAGVRLTEVPPHEPGVIDPIFPFSDSLGLFTWNSSCGKNIVHRGLQGGHQSGTVIFFNVVFGKTSIAETSHMINIKLFLKNKFQINRGVFVPKITWSHICVFP